MVNEVFVNNREVACKAAEGKSVAAFPDVCFTPPRTQGSPPGIPIPYPNTAYAKDTANGSKTVMITGKQVVLKDKSYFKTSTGDEAGCADKGIKTGKIKGKAYFNSWSMNVFIEGYNVCRHLDLTTHNHGSKPGNTPPWKYLDTSASSKSCKGEVKKAKDACELSDKEKQEFENDQKRRNRKRRKKKKRALAIREMGWKDKHCTGLMRIKPYKAIEQTKKGLEDAVADVKSKIDNIEEILVEKGIEIAKDKTEKVAARAGAKYLGSLIGGPAAPFLAGISTIVSVVDGVYSTVSGAMDVYDLYQKYGDKINQLKGVASQVKDRMDSIKKGIELLKDEKSGTLSEKGKEELKKLKKKIAEDGDLMADAQDAQALADPCLRAMKCILTPYNQKQGMQAAGNKPQQEGCCPGQTGHHIPPKAYFKNCNSYDKGEALAVCASGVDQRSGSHGKLHDWQDNIARDKLEDDGSLSYDNAIEASVKAHKETFPASGCDAECIRAQIKESLEDCKNSTINPVDKEGAKLKQKNTESM